MKRRWWNIATVVGFLSTGFVVGGLATAHPIEDAGPSTAPPPALSTSGDYATDVLGDAWDFSNDDDVPPIPIIGSENGFGISRSGGVLSVAAGNGTQIKLVRTWGAVLPWGRDGLRKPIDAATYTHLTIAVNLDQK